MKQRFTIRKLDDGQFQLLDDGLVYSTYETKEAAEADAAAILDEDNRELLRAAREFKYALGGEAPLAHTKEGKELEEAVLNFLVKYSN